MKSKIFGRQVRQMTTVILAVSLSFSPVRAEQNQMRESEVHSGKETEIHTETLPEPQTENITEQFQEELPEETETEEAQTQNWLDEMDNWMEEQEEDVQWEEEYDYEEIQEEELPDEVQESGASVRQVQPEAKQYLQAEQYLQAVDLERYLPVKFEHGISSLEWFPENRETERVVQNGYTMVSILPKSTADKGQVGARYRKIAVQGEKWYDLKMTLIEFEETQIISKEGTLNVFSGASFCTDRIGWAIRGQQGNTVLKMEFVENGTDKTSAINARFKWSGIDLDNRPQISLEDGSFGAHYYVEKERKGFGDMVFLLKECSTWYLTWGSTEKTVSEVICQEDIVSAQPEREDGSDQRNREQTETLRQDPQVRLFVTKRNLRTKQWVKDTLFEVYEWDGYDYAIYRGCLAYDVERNCYVMDGLVRNEVNRGKYVIIEAVEEARTVLGWRQEILVPDRPVVTDLYYRVER